MHRISEIEVINFKSISHATFQFAPYTPIVGYNNAGKSSILQALNWVVAPHSLQSADFGDVDRAVSVCVQVDGIDENVLAGLGQTHRERIEPHVLNGSLRFKRECATPKIAPSKFSFKIEDRSDLGLETTWVDPPNGFAPALKALFPESIHIKAMQDAAEDVEKNSTSTTIGKLVRAIFDSVRDRYETDIQQLLEPVASRLMANSPNKDESLVSVDNAISGYLSKFFPGLTARTHIPMPDVEDFLKKATIQVAESDFANTYESVSKLGHGAQRTVQFALINALAQMKRDLGQAQDGRTILLLIDEPELYLHPQAIAAVKNGLRALAGQGFQVAFSTHSGEMIDREDAPNTMIICRPQGESCSPRSIMANAANVINEADQQADIVFELSNSKQFLFSDHLFLVEGRTEQIILPEIFHVLTGSTLEEKRIGIIKLDGSGGLIGASKILGAMGFAPKIIADLDFIFKEAPKHGIVGIADERLNEMRGVCQRLADNNQIECGDDGFPKRSNHGSAERGFVLAASDDTGREIVASFLGELREQGVWIWPRGAFEEHIALPSKKLAVQRRFVEDFRSEAFRNNLPDLNCVVEALSFAANFQIEV